MEEIFLIPTHLSDALQHERFNCCHPEQREGSPDKSREVSLNMQYLIVANSPVFIPALVNELAVNKRVVALDGAVCQLMSHGINFDVLLGDFDSIDLANIRLPQSVQVIHTPDQNQTDLEKAIDYCDEQQASRIDIVCATSGRMDHTLRNVGLLRMKYKVERAIFLHTEYQTLEFVRDKTITIQGQIGDYCGVLAFPAASFTSHGLMYEGENYELIFGIQESTSNQLKQTTASIQVKGEALVVHPGNLVAQRDMNA
jgi:thiamine pyrophosphokinase